MIGFFLFTRTLLTCYHAHYSKWEQDGAKTNDAEQDVVVGEEHVAHAEVVRVEQPAECGQREEPDTPYQDVRDGVADASFARV